MKKTLLCFLLLFTNLFYAQISSITICAGESFDLTTLKADFIGNLNPNETTVNYFLSEDDALNKNNEIQNANNFFGFSGVTVTIFARIDNNGVITTNKYVNFRVNYPLVLHTTVEPINCARPTGRLTLFADGGTGPYLYSSDGITYNNNRFFSDLNIGTYTYYTKDAIGCITSQNVTVENPQPLSLKTRKNDVDCSGRATGVIWTEVSGGTTPYSYYIINSAGKTVHKALNSDSNSLGFTGLVPDTYTVQILDNNSCDTQTAQIEITEPAPLALNTVITSETCANSGTITILATGGITPYKYNLDSGPPQTSNIFTNVSSGAHVVYLTDSNNCIIYKITEKVEISSPPVGILTVKDPICHGATDGKITIEATQGEAPYQYSIGNGFQSDNTFANLAAGEYTLSIKDAKGCISSYTTQILDPILISAKANIVNSTTTNDNNGQIAIVPLTGIGPFTFALTDNSGLAITPFQKTNLFTGLKSGVYGYQLKDGLGCIFTQNNISLLNAPATLDASVILSPITCSTNGKIIVTASGGASPYTYAINGVDYQSNNTFENLPAGTYNITVKDAENTISNSKIVVINALIPINVTATNTSLFCATETATLTVTATGGQAPYFYSVNNSAYQTTNTFTYIYAGTYTIKVKDSNDCITTLTHIITGQEPLTASFSVEGKTLTISDTKGGVQPYQYSFNHGTFQDATIFSNLQPGFHSIKIKDASGCQSFEFSVMIEDTDPLTTAAAITKQVDCNSNAVISVSATGGQAPYTYSINGVTFQTSNIFNNLTEGSYSITVKDANGALATTNNITVVPVSFPVIYATQTNVSCYLSADGTINLNATGGKAPYAYSLNNSTFVSTNFFTNLSAGVYEAIVKDANGCLSSYYININEPTPIQITLTHTDSTNGNNGKITIAATGGFPPYTYALTSNGIPSSVFQSANIFDGLQAGYYDVQVKDANGCIAIQTVSIIDQPASLLATATVTQITCTNPTGIIIVTTTGGTAPYTYSFDNGINYGTSNVFSNVNPGTYTIKVRDAENSTFTLYATLTLSTPLIATTAITSTIHCNGSNDAAIQITTSGGKAPYLYSINGSPYQASNIFSNLSAGNYIVNVKDSNDCSSIMVLDITEPVLLISTINVTDNSVTINTTGGSGTYTYAISTNLAAFSTVNTFTNLEVGSYTIITRDTNGCFATINFVINPPAPLAAGKDEVVVDFKPGQTLADLTVEGQDIKWYSSPNSPSGKTSKTNETPLPLTTVLVDGTTYYASQTINGIESKERLAVTAKLNGALGTPDFNLTSFQFYPNPVENILNIKNNSLMDEIQIIDVFGKSILFKKINDLHSQIDLSNLSSGVYIMKVKSENKQKTIKFIKE